MRRHIFLLPVAQKLSRGPSDVATNVKPWPLLCILHMPAKHLCHRSVGAEKKRYVECEPGFENTPDISGRVDIALEKGERERVRVKREIALKKTRCRNERE